MALSKSERSDRAQDRRDRMQREQAREAVRVTREGQAKAPTIRWVYDSATGGYKPVQ
jgi:hypothetical protein